MVTRVWGHVEGVEVIFTHLEGDTWACNVPKELDGEYVVDVYAEDEYGNIGYAATILFVIDARHLTFKIKVLRFAGESKVDKFIANGKVKDFTMNAIRCEVCGGDMYTTR